MDEELMAMKRVLAILHALPTQGARNRVISWVSEKNYDIPRIAGATKYPTPQTTALGETVENP